MPREARYTAQLSVLVEESTKAWIKETAEQYANVADGDVIRVALEAGRAAAVAHFAKVGKTSEITLTDAPAGVSFSG